MSIFWVGLIGQMGMLHNTLQFPMPLGGVKRCWKDTEDGFCLFLSLFSLVFIDSGGLGGCCKGEGKIWRD